MSPSAPSRSGVIAANSGIGGGVVQDSRMAGEYAECLLKARFFETARKPLELIETLRYEDGFVRLESRIWRGCRHPRACSRFL